jgi:hypothetical protein
MRFSVLLTFITATAAAALPTTEGETAERKTAVSPDGYTYTVEARAYVPETVTLDDGTTATVHIHPDFAFVRHDGTTPHKVDKRAAQWKDGGRDQCGDSDFKKKTSGGSPKTVDCKAISTNYATSNGHFVARSNKDFPKFSGDWLRLAMSGSCAFGIKSSNMLDPRVGASDIAELVNGAMVRYKSSSSPSRVGAEGSMGCNHNIMSGLFGKAKVDWAIFRA